MKITFRWWNRNQGGYWTSTKEFKDKEDLDDFIRRMDSKGQTMDEQYGGFEND